MFSMLRYAFAHRTTQPSGFWGIFFASGHGVFSVWQALQKDARLPQRGSLRSV